MKKVLLVFMFVMIAAFMCGCERNNNEAETTDVNNYLHIAEYEKRYGLVSMPSGNYTIGTVDPDSELSERGIFRKTDNGYELAVNFGVIGAQNGFWENDSYYLMMGNTITEYPLSAENPHNSSESTVLLPNMAEIKHIYYSDEEYFYVLAALWDEVNARHFKENCYKISRDGSSYEEINYNDIPTDK